MGSDASCVTLGTIGAPNGLKGWLKVRLCMHSPEDLVSYRPCFIKKQGELVPIEIEQVKNHGAKCLLKIKGIDCIEDAEQYRLLDLVVSRDTLPTLAEGEYYWSDLEGLEVWCNQKNIGKVSYLFNNAGLDVIVVANGKQTHNIPFILNDTVKNVDLVSRRIELDWPEDML
jgi:16S rRNA processing protein RimM